MDRIIHLLLLALVLAILFEPGMFVSYLPRLEEAQILLVLQAFNHDKLPYRDFFVLFGPMSYVIPGLFIETFAHLSVSPLLALRISVISGWALFHATSFLFVSSVFKELRWIVLCFLGCIFYTHTSSWCYQWGGFRFAFPAISVALILSSCMAKQRGEISVLQGVCVALTFLTGVDQSILVCLFIVAALVIAGRAQFQIETAKMAAGFFATLAIAFLTFWRFGFLEYYLLDLLTVFNRAKFFQSRDLDEIAIAYIGQIFILACFACIYLFRTRHIQLSKDRALVALLLTWGTLQFLYAFRAPRGPQTLLAYPALLTAGIYSARMLFGLSRKAANIEAIPVLILVALVILPTRSNSNGLLGFLLHQKDKYEAVLGSSIGASQAVRTMPFPILGTEILFEEPDASDFEASVAEIRKFSPGSLLAYPEFPLFNVILELPFPGYFPIPSYAIIKANGVNSIVSSMQNECTVVVIRGDEVGGILGTTKIGREFFKPLDNYVQENYQLVKKFPKWDILVRKSNSCTSSFHTS